MGVTGSGRSSFISLCTGKPVRIGHDLIACKRVEPKPSRCTEDVLTVVGTSIVDVYAYEVSAERTIYLIDTPGFDDSTRSDTQVLSEIAAWLGDCYKNKILLHGILYLHRITDIRMQGSAKKNLLMFKQLCGQDALRKVILVTTMWDKLLGRESEGASREKELMDTPEFWGWMLAKGSSSHRHDNTEFSARNIVDLLARHNEPIATDLQKQLVDESRTLDQTSAGQHLEGELRLEMEKWARERRETEQQILAAIQQRDREAEEAMREERDRFTRMIEKVESDTENLRLTMEKLLLERDERVARVEQELKEKLAARQEEQREAEDRSTQVSRERERIEAARKKGPGWPLWQGKQQPSSSVRGTLPSANQTPVYPKYSVTMFGEHIACSSPYRWVTSSGSSELRVMGGSILVHATSYGSPPPRNSKTGPHWICRYAEGSWSKYIRTQVLSWGAFVIPRKRLTDMLEYSYDLEQDYQMLGTALAKFSTKTLEYCSLGPSGKFYARWAGQTPSYLTMDGEMATALGLYSNVSRVFAVAFGFANSFVISYGPDELNLDTLWNLRGHYAHLKDFLEKPRDICIVVRLGILSVLTSS